MPKSRQTIPPKQPSITILPSRAYTVMQFRSTQNEDDDDICPVCESECTCRNNNSSGTSRPTYQPSAPLPSLPSSTPTQVPLRIKLPARSTFSTLQDPSAIKHTKPKSNKPNETTVGSAIVDGNTSTHFVIVHRPGLFSTQGHQLDSPAPLVSSSNALSPCDSSPLTSEFDIKSPPKASRTPKQPAKAAIPKSRKKTTVTKAKSHSGPTGVQKKLTTGTKNRTNKNSAWAASPVRRKGKRVNRTRTIDSAEDEFTDREAYVARISHDSDGAESGHFPTFISAISTTSDNEDSASTMTDSFDSDSSIRAEEEELILVEEQRAKIRREILNTEDSWHMEKRKWDHLKNNNNWEIRPRKRSVGPESDSESDSESESETEAEEEEEEEGEDDDEPDIRYGHGLVTGWQSDDDFDAELFFATLTDSSGPGSDADAEDGEDSGGEQSDTSDLSTISMTEAAAAGLFQSPYGSGCPLVVTEDWDGRLVFANGLRDGQGVLDFHFEVDAAQRHRSIRESMEVDSTEAEGDAQEDGDEDDFLSDDDGETTDDMLDHRPSINTPHGVVPLPFRCPTPPVTSIDPKSTFSPIIDARRNKLINSALSVESPKPSDILAGSRKLMRETTSGLDDDSNLERSPAAISAASPSISSVQSRHIPSMGCFKQVSKDPKRSAIIDGTKVVSVSPFGRIKRARRHSGRGRKRMANEHDIFPYVSKRPRQSSLPGSSRATLPVDEGEDGDPLVQSSPELPVPATFIGLDDVLDASFLDSDGSVESAASTSDERHLRNFSRWDRMPISTFRRSRAAHISEINVNVSSLPPPNDGVSYGSASGYVLRRSPLGAPLWQINSGKEKSGHRPQSVCVSPVIFPTHNGERIPSVGQYPDSVSLLPTGTYSSKSHKQKRKEKKKRNNVTQTSSAIASVPTPDGFHHLPPVIPPLSL